MKRVVLLLVAVVLVSVLVLSGCAKATPAPAPAPAPTPAPAPAPAAPKVIELKHADYFAPAHTMSVAGELLDKMIVDFTGGKVKITSYHAEALGKAGDQIKMVQGGVCDIATLASPFHPEIFQLEMWHDLPLLGVNNRTIIDTVDWELYYKGYYKGLNDFKVLAFFGTPLQNIHLRMPVLKLDDFKGVKVRSPSTLTSDLISAMGGTPVSIPSSEVYMALDRHTVDGAYSGYDMSIAQKWYEVAKHTIWKPGISAGTIEVVMSNNVWKGLPADVQAGIERAIVAFRYEYQRSYQDSDLTAADQLKQKGVTLYELSASDIAKMQSLAVPVRDKWIADKEAKGLPAKEMMALVNKIIARYQ